ncbi:hypothetical protein NPX13_g10833 [Xylaria arbuscula]|uniref:Uncharacterized protein n=1 Tax=Xylaria arbuscula TaxID=114810 RepID=A0A9W8TH47_9PEZI|nr:hypothetical protein NPX13_g10833 [Xylaria arbuscula]
MGGQSYANLDAAALFLDRGHATAGREGDAQVYDVQQSANFSRGKDEGTEKEIATKATVTSSVCVYSNIRRRITGTEKTAIAPMDDDA